LSRAEGVLRMKTLTTISRFRLLCPVSLSFKRERTLMSFRRR
jgi:hypothetical protein